MAKQPTIVDDNDGSIEIDLSQRKSRQFGGTDESPTDADTGEEVFADLTPRLRTMQVEETEEDETELDEDEESAAIEEDEPVIADEDDEEAEEGASRKPKSKWEKRLEREQRLRREEKEANEALRARLQKLEDNQKAQASDEEFGRESTRLNREIVKAREELKKAMEEGETEAQLRLTEALQDLKVELKTKESDHKRAKESVQQNSASNEASTVVVTKVRQWMRKHPKFNTDPGFAALVRATDKLVAADGFDPESDEFYGELDKRLKKRYPEEYPAARKVRNHPSANQRREASAPSKNAGDFQTRNGKVTLTARQVANMRQFQLDPTNPADVREYVISNRKG